MGSIGRFLRGFVIRVVEIMSYVGILASAYAGSVFGNTDMAKQMLNAQLPVEISFEGTSPFYGAVLGLISGALAFGLILTLIDIREQLRRGGLPKDQ